MSDFSTSLGAESTYRVPHSRADDFYELGRPMPHDAMLVGIVTAIEDDDTVTVQIDDEELLGCLYEGDTPSVGDFVRMRSSDQFLVIMNDTGTTVYVQPDEPPGVPVGTLWFDTDEVRP